MKRRSLLGAAAGVAATASWPIRGANADVPAVTSKGHEKIITNASISVLKSQLRGELLKPGDAPYDAARKLWSGSFDKRPALIARCKGADDVIAAVNFARNSDLLVAVRAGGHSYSGQSACDGGLMIDLQTLKGISIDPKARTARVAGGTLLGEMDVATQAHGLATTAGVVPHTGVAGLTLGGGVGRLLRKHGMTIDNVLSVDIVTADGRFLRASSEENPDLFWGVRGGGGNFGVVTSFEYRLHRLGPMVTNFSYAYALDQAAVALRSYFDFMKTAPDDIYGVGGLFATAKGGTIASISGCHVGLPRDADRALAPLAKIGKPISAQVGLASYVELQQGGPNPFPHGLGNYSKGGFTTGDPAQIGPLIESFARKPAAGGHAIFLAMGGAAARVAPDATAFAHRDAQYQIDIGGSWVDPAGYGEKAGEEMIAWSRAIWAAIETFSDGGFYANQSMETGDRAIRENYRGNYDRLVELKTKYDPSNFFHLNANIRPKA